MTPPEPSCEVYWDACVFLSAVDKVPDRMPVIESLMADAENGRLRIYTSTLSITEVAYAKNEKAKTALDPAIEEKIDQLWIPPSPVVLVELHQGIAMRAKALIREAMTMGWSLKPADAIHLASAEAMNVSEFNSYDGPLAKYEAILPYKIGPPYAAVLPMPTA